MSSFSILLLCIWLNPNNASGQSWKSLPFQEPVRVFDIAVSMGDLLAGIQERVMRSTDGGTTWTPADQGLAAGRVTALLRVDTTASGLAAPGLIAAQDQTLYHSKDGGRLWTKALFPPFAETVVRFRKVREGIEAVLNLFPDLADPSSRMLSKDGGLSWSQPEAWVVGTDGEPVGNGKDTLYRVAANTLQISLDKGGHWAKSAFDTTLGVPKTVSAANGAIFIAMQQGQLLVSSDRGRTWRFLFVGFNSNRIHALAADGNSLCAGTSFGISCSEDGGAHWNYRRPSPLNAENQSLALADGYIFITRQRGFSGNAVVRYDPDRDAWGQASWEPGLQLNNAGIAAQGSTVLAWDQSNPRPYSLISRDHGSTWAAYSKGPKSEGIRDGFFGTRAWILMTSRVWFVSLDQGNTWREPGFNPGGFNYDQDLAVSGYRAFMTDAVGRIWTADVRSDTWETVDTPAYLGANKPVSDSDLGVTLAGSDSGLFVATPTGLWKWTGPATGLRRADAKPSAGDTKTGRAHRKTPAHLRLPDGQSGSVSVYPGSESSAPERGFDMRGAHSKSD